MKAAVRPVPCDYLTGCPLCAGTGFFTETEGRDFESGTGSYRVERCRSCGLRFTNPRPAAAALGDLYGSRDSADYPRPHPVTDALRALAIRRSISALARHSGECESVLDYGCGDGFFAVQLARCGHFGSITAVDLHESPPVYLQRRDAVRYRSFAQLGTEGGQYQLICCRHVIEHIADPAAAAAQLEMLLAPGALLVVEVPNIDSAWRKLFGRYYFGWYLPRHLLHFDRHTLCRVFGAFRQIRLYHRHTPVLGKSLGYLSGLALGNLGLVGLALFPLQVLVDRLARTSSVLSLVLRKREER